MKSSLPDLLLQLANALKRIERKAQPLLENPALLNQEVGQDLLDVICEQSLPLLQHPVQQLQQQP
jgi:hypothetical protein